MATRKVKISIAACVLAFSAAAVLGGCSSTDTGAAPKVSGAHDLDCITNTTVDLLDGVAALDDEDGDITPQMTITTAPEVEVTDGYAVFPSEGSYRVTYAVEDSDGNTASTTAIVTATDRETYKDFVSVNGFRGAAYGGASLTKNGMYNGVYLITATGCEIAEDLRLTRTYSLITGIEYTFTYTYNSTAGGKAYIYANGEPAGEAMIYEGDNSVSFTYTATGDSSSEDVEISLYLGAISSDITFNLQSASFGHAQEAGNVTLLDDFTFTSSNCIERFDGTSGSVSIGAENASATLSITSTGDDLWRGGMFIQTSITTTANTQYTVGFDIISTQANTFEVKIQENQWDETQYALVTCTDGQTTQQHYDSTFTATSSNAGALWLYVQSGTAVNEITISNLTVSAYMSAGNVEESVELKDFEGSNEDGSFTLETNAGSFKYTVPEFSDTDWHQQVTSPEFYVSGSGSNYVITFKAKATKPVVTVFAAPVYGGWDPTLAWQRITITEDEQDFAIWCSDSGGNTNYLVWQFGSSANVAYKNVTIEVSDIKICYRNATLDDFD